MTTTVSQEAREAEVTQDDIGWATSAAQHLCSLQDRDAAIRLLAQAFARHRQSAERETLARMEPVAWMYERKGKVRIDHSPTCSEDMTGGWTATPLYVLPPAPEARQ